MRTANLEPFLYRNTVLHRIYRSGEDDELHLNCLHLLTQWGEDRLSSVAFLLIMMNKKRSNFKSISVTNLKLMLQWRRVKVTTCLTRFPTARERSNSSSTRQLSGERAVNLCLHTSNTDETSTRNPYGIPSQLLYFISAGLSVRTVRFRSNRQTVPDAGAGTSNLSQRVTDSGGAAPLLFVVTSGRVNWRIPSPVKKFLRVDASRRQDGGVCHGGWGAVVRSAGPGARWGVMSLSCVMSVRGLGWGYHAV